MTEKKPIGYKRNLLCNEAKGEILINMDDDDFYPSTRVSHAVEKLDKSQAYIAGCSHNYLYDEKNGITECGAVSSYHAVAGTFAFFKEYLEKNQFDDNAVTGEELSFTHHFTNPLIQLDSIKTILVVCHNQNTHNKDQLLKIQSELKLKDFVKEKAEYDFYMTAL